MTPNTQITQENVGLLKAGDVNPVGVNRFVRGKPKPSAQERIVLGVAHDTNGGCWLWSELTNKAGYGRVCFEGKHLLAHRMSYEAFIGPIPDGSFVCHRCDVPACVNPAHLFLGSHEENMADMARKGRSQKNEGRRGSSAPHAKITEADVVAIRASPLPNKQVAHQFRMSVGNIEKIRARKSWSHVQ